MNKKDKKSVVIVAASISSIREPLQVEYKKLGYIVYWFDYRKSSLLEKFVFAPSIIFPFLWKIGNYLLNQRLIRFVKKIKPEIVFVSKGETVLGGTVKEIRKISITINWYTDLFETIPRMINIFPEYDYVFTVDSSDVDNYKNQMNVFYMPFASNVVIKKLNFNNRKYDVVFIGTWTKKREELLSRLEGLNLYIWGDKKWHETKLGKYYQKKWLSSADLLKIFSQAKIAINERQNKNKKYTMPNLRLFEASASGALVLTDYLKDLNSLFNIEDSKEMIIYKDGSDLRKKVDYYLSNDNERINVAKKGYKRSIRDHSYDKRLKEIMKIINFK